MESFRIKRLRADAALPARATPGSAAYDLCSIEDAVLCPGEMKTLGTGIALELPGAEYVALVFARSGMGIKHGVTLSNSVGVIDSDYRGEVRVGLINHGGESYTVKAGERIAQLLVVPLAPLVLEEAEELGETQRGTGGLGSTGKR